MSAWSACGGPSASAASAPPHPRAASCIHAKSQFRLEVMAISARSHLEVMAISAGRHVEVMAVSARSHTFNLG